MKWFKNLRNKFRSWRIQRQRDAAPALREFVYLDSTSLKSLLISQRDTLPAETKQTISRADEAEVSARAAAGNKLVGEAEAGSTVRSSSSSDFQQTRKAEIQTLFKEFRDLPAYHLKIGPEEPVVKGVRRGDLVELRVELSPDPLYELIALTREFGSLAEAAPHIMGGNQTLHMLAEVRPIMQMLDQLMAGLIPVKAKVIDYVVVCREDQEVIVKTDELKAKEHHEPLFLVGVTEAENYWRDLRRIVFSHARYTVMARISRDGLHREWTPVKGADLFTDVAPDFMEKLRAVEFPKQGEEGQIERGTTPRQEAFQAVLRAFKDEALSEVEQTLSEEIEKNFDALVSSLASAQDSVQAQAAAFRSVQTFLEEHGVELDPERLADLRESARHSYGFELTPTSALEVNPKSSEFIRKDADEWLLDTEVIAIYW